MGLRGILKYNVFYGSTLISYTWELQQLQLLLTKNAKTLFLDRGENWKRPDDATGRNQLRDPAEKITGKTRCSYVTLDFSVVINHSLSLFLLYTCTHSLTHPHTHTNTHRHLHLHSLTHTHTHTRMHSSSHTHTQIFIRPNTHVPTHGSLSFLATRTVCTLTIPSTQTHICARTQTLFLVFPFYHYYFSLLKPGSYYSPLFLLLLSSVLSLLVSKSFFICLSLQLSLFLNFYHQCVQQLLNLAP